MFTWGLVFSMTSSPSPSCPVSPWPTVSTCPLPLVGDQNINPKLLVTNWTAVFHQSNLWFWQVKCWGFSRWWGHLVCLNVKTKGVSSTSVFLFFIGSPFISPLAAEEGREFEGRPLFLPWVGKSGICHQFFWIALDHRVNRNKTAKFLLARHKFILLEKSVRGKKFSS